MYISPSGHFDANVERSIVVETGFRESDVETVDIIPFYVIMIVAVQHTVAVDRRGEDTSLVRFHQSRFHDQ